MDKLLKAALSIIFAAVLICTSAVYCFATEYTYMDGYKLAYVSTHEVSLCGWNNSSATLPVPEMVGKNYVVSIEKFAFVQDDFIEEIDFSQAKALKTIGVGAFAASTALKKLDIPDTVTDIKKYAFSECTALETAEINANISVLKEEMFRLCSSLKSVTLPESLTTIEDYAFEDCPVLTQVMIGKNVTSIAESAFNNSPNVTISCYPDSYAYQYAVDHNIPVKLLHDVKLGDANGDGSVNINDVTAIQGHKAEMLVLDELQQLAADVNYDGKVDIEDATLMQSYLAEYAVDYAVNTTVTR